MRKPFWGAQLLSVCSSRGCSPWPGMGRGGIQFTHRIHMKPVLVLSQEQNAVCVTYTPQVPAAGKARLHLFRCPWVFMEVSCLEPPRSLTAHHRLGDFVLQQLNSIFNVLRFSVTDSSVHQLGGWCFSPFLQTWFQQLSFLLGGPSFP